MFNFFKKNKNKSGQQTTTVSPEQQELTRKKRMAAAVLVVGIGSLVFSIWNINRLLKVPDVLSLNSNQNASSQISLSNTNTEPVRLEELRSRDTDKDGLSDYDELYLYKTSPYIADSDSDKISDQDEVGQNTDPNCPQGTECGRVTTVNGATNAATNTNSAFSDLQPEIDINNLTPDQLRDLLRNSGASEEALNQITDEQLLETYREVLGTNANTNASLTNTTTSTGTITYDQLKNLTPAEIRQFLEASGIPKSTLDVVDDTTLQTIYLQALEEQQSSGQ